MDALLSILRKRATLRNALVFLALFILNAVILGQVDKPLEVLASGEPKLDLRFGYDRAAVEQLFSAYGEDGRAFYGLNLLVDTPFPILGAAATILFVLLAFDNPAWQRLLIIPPLLFAATDLVENILLYSLAQAYPSLSDALVGTASFITQVKRSAFYASVVELVVSGLIAAAFQIRRRRPAARTG